MSIINHGGHNFMVKKNRILFRIRICCLVGISALILFAFGACGEIVLIRRDYAEVFLNNWGIVLPGDMTEEFRKSEDNWGPGDGTRYAVFKLTEEPADFIADFSKEKDEEIENKVNRHLLYAQFNIPKNFLPVWGSSYYSKHIEKEFRYSDIGIVLDHCYLIYSPGSFRLMICQYFP